MEIGILGTGNVGSALARGFDAAGHDVVLGSRTPDETAIDGLRVVDQRAAAEHGDAVVLALPSDAIDDVAADLSDALADKPTIDTANEYPTASDGPSIAERVAEAAPDAKVVKAFNTIGANLMTDPVVDGERATMFLAGDDAIACEQVDALATDLGFDVVPAGALARAELLEDLARLWIHCSGEYGRDIAFRLLRE
ncbi:NADPH-dependent F420 reductase [Halosolutus gelatinilyticus]|uniref:NADPH-dependent F420 reductase n=1 Tax=Halosolutus gelatinilyticus TaxID=2931975 RepID=UPI001FF2BD57|nr:NAD(P)-binding domain-containing protein [Halosolutus gelatinilyticus]